LRRTGAEPGLQFVRLPDGLDPIDAPLIEQHDDPEEQDDRNGKPKTGNR
jgi:hypothetical protein